MGKHWFGVFVVSFAVVWGFLPPVMCVLRYL